MRPFEVKSHYLPGSVHTAIGAPGCQQCLPLPAQLPQSIFKDTLHGADMSLPLKALELRAVVGEDNLVTFHISAISRQRVQAADRHLLGLFFNQLDQDHLGGIAQAFAEFHHTGVTTRARLKAGGNVIKQFVDGFIAAQASGCQAAGMNGRALAGFVATLGQGDQALSLATNGLGFGAGGLNAFVFEQLLDQGAAQGDALILAAA